MARKATDQVTKRGVKIGKSSFHLIGLDGRLGSRGDSFRLPRMRLLLRVRQTKSARNGTFGEEVRQDFKLRHEPPRRVC